jgi:hypothetical protein
MARKLSPLHSLIWLSAAAFTLAGELAQAACVEMWARKWAGAAQTSVPRTDFQVNDLFVLCIKFEEDAYVSIWDASPKTVEVSRLYPNVLTHMEANAVTRAEKLAGGKEHCFGTPETFPLFFPSDQGVGTGTLSVYVTKNLDDQPALEDFKVPGQRMLHSRISAATNSFESPQRCSSKMKAYLEYKITR